jgi:hypothetical protein
MSRQIVFRYTCHGSNDRGSRTSQGCDSVAMPELINTYESRDVRLVPYRDPLAARSEIGAVERPFLMNANFVFPRPHPQSGLPRPRPARAAKWSSPSSLSNLASSRNSNALRASILDTALELGIGTNSLVTDWMFNNPLLEEPDDAVSLFYLFFIQVLLSCKLFSGTASVTLSHIAQRVNPRLSQIYHPC